MQPEAASTPLRQLYFVVQTMILDPLNAHLTTVLLHSQVSLLEKHADSAAYLQVVETVKQLAGRESFFEALKVLRKSFDMEDQLMGSTTLPCRREIQAA